MKHSLPFLAALAALATSAAAQSVAYQSQFGTQAGAPYTYFTPNSVATYNATGEVFVTNQSSKKVTRFSAAGVFELEWGSQGTGDGQFNFPTGVAVNQSTGHVYVGDSNNRRVEEFDVDGTFVRSIATDFRNQFNQLIGFPQDIAVNSTTGDIYVSASSTIRRYSADGTFIFTWTPGGNSLALDPTTGNILVSDGDHTVKRFSAAGALISSFGETGTDPGQFTIAGHLAVDTHGNIYVVDPNVRVDLFGPAGNFLTAFGSVGADPGQFSRAGGIGVSATNAVFVIDDNTAKVLLFQTTLPADPTPPSPAAPPPATITGKKSITTTKSKYTLKGKVPAGAGVVSVKVKVGKKPYKNAQGTTSWSFNAPLANGKNVLLVETVNASGAVSSPVKVQITRKPQP